MLLNYIYIYYDNMIYDNMIYDNMISFMKLYDIISTITFMRFDINNDMI